MSTLRSMPAVALVLSWSVLGLLFWASWKASPVLLGLTGALAVVSLGLEIYLLRRKAVARGG